MISRVLFLSGRQDDARNLSRMLLDLPVILDHEPTLQRARSKLRQDCYQVVLTEAALPDGSWVDALCLAREISPDLAVIVTSRQADAHLWAEALNLGAYDLLVQPFYKPEVARILSNACSRLHAGAASMAAV